MTLNAIDIVLSLILAFFWFYIAYKNYRLKKANSVFIFTIC